MFIRLCMQLLTLTVQESPKAFFKDVTPPTIESVDDKYSGIL